MENWDEIRTAFQVARLGTVSGAADVLGVHHATVIRHIDALEKRLGTQLMHRSTRRDLERSQQLLARTLRTTLKSLMKPMFHPRIPTTLLRAGMRLLTSSTLRAAGVRLQPLQLGSVRGEVAMPSKVGHQAVLYLHGGAFFAGSPRTHRSLARALARSLGASVFVCDYRLALYATPAA